MPKCPNCGSKKVESGYGLAGGGIGCYLYCEDCAHIFDKVQDPEMTEPKSHGHGEP
jgi:hypothetical protein